MTACFPDAESATAYRDACNAAKGLPRPGTPPTPPGPNGEPGYGWTVSWADVREVDGAYPIPVCDAVPVPEGVPTIQIEETPL